MTDNNIIVAEKNSELNIVIKYTTQDDTVAIHNGITKIIAKEGSKVNLIKVQSMNDKSIHFDSNISFVSSLAQVKCISIEIGSNISVTNYVSDLTENLSESVMKSIYFGSKDMTIDLSYDMVHRGMRTKSDIETRGVLKDTAKKIFRGTLDFKKGATRSDGAEGEHVILLSPSVKSDSIPLLLCGEDDVTGAHAASVGKIDENKLFYLMSRGFNEKEAKKLIIEGSFSDIIDEIPLIELREEILDNIQRRLEDE
ncbi:FeS cluster assembly protein SufD [compost metagenome]